MLAIARNNHIGLPYRSTNKSAVHQGASIPSTLSGTMPLSLLSSCNSLARLFLFCTPDAHLNSLKEGYLRGCVSGISTGQNWVFVFSIILAVFSQFWEANASNSSPTKPNGYGWIPLGGL